MFARGRTIVGRVACGQRVGVGSAQQCDHSGEGWGGEWKGNSLSDDFLWVRLPVYQEDI